MPLIAINDFKEILWQRRRFARWRGQNKQKDQWSISTTRLSGVKAGTGSEQNKQEVKFDTMGANTILLSRTKTHTNS